MVTIAPSNRITSYNPVTPTTDFPVGFPIFFDGDVGMTVNGVPATFTITATYTEGVSTNAVCKVAAPGVTGAVFVFGQRSPARTDQYKNGAPLSIPDHNYSLNRLTIENQEAHRDLGRTMKLPIGAPPLPEGHFAVSDGAGGAVDGGDAGDIADAQENAAAALAARLAAEAARDVILSAVPTLFAATIAALKGLTIGLPVNARLTAAGRAGNFILVDYSAFSTLIDLDTQNGMFARSTTNPAKAWMRVTNGPMSVLWFMNVVPPDATGWDALDGGNKRGPNRLAQGALVFTGIDAAWTFALATKQDLYFPAGRYEISGEVSMPFRQAYGVITTLQDCKNITIHGDGDLTVLATNSQDGADVLQLNALKNFHVRRLKIGDPVISGTAAHGSNGISVTNGFDNITIVDVSIENCPTVDKGTYADGGAGVSLQMTTAVTEWGTFVADNVRVVGCRDGFGFEGINTEALTRRTSITVNNYVAQDCYIAYKVASGAATGALNANMWSGISIVGKAINCQRDTLINRVLGVKADVEVITTKTAAARRLKPGSAVPWFAADTIVDALFCCYAKNSLIVVRGDKGGCDYKAQIGAVADPSSGLNGATEFTTIVMDIGGTAVTSSVNIVDVGGANVRLCDLSMSQRTATAWPSLAVLVANGNKTSIGPVQSLITPVIRGALSLQQSAAGNVETGVIDYTSGVTTIRGKGSGTAGALVLGFLDNGGSNAFGVKNSSGAGARLWLGAGIPTFADATAAAAAGFVSGDVFRTSAGMLGVIP